VNRTVRSDPVERWGMFELALSGPASGNPFLEVELSAGFHHKNRTAETEGFYDGEGNYRIRFMPDELGSWIYETSSNCPEVDGVGGSFTAIEPKAGNHGPVRVRNTYHMAYADGMPYRPIGTTCYAWIHQPEALQMQTLDTLAGSPFNKLRMCVFPKHYTYNTQEPTLFPFERAGDGWDYARFDPAFFRNLDRRVGDLLGIGIEADIILFHPYDRWGFSRMSGQEDERYARYVVARLAAYRNVWWSLANEYDIMRKPVEAWDHLFQVVQEHDPVQHLRSVHNWQALETHDCRTFYDHGQPWVTHCSVQHSHVNLISMWRQQYRKPVIVDEACYEGDLPNGWGNITGIEMTRRFWEGTASGGYVGHGETFLHPGDVIWWSKGGTLHGDSPARIAFLRRILEEGPSEGLDPVGNVTNTHLVSVGQAGKYYLTYFGYRQPAEVTFSLPEGQRYQADLIDTWEMTTVPLADLVERGTTIRLPRKPYLAVRLWRTG